MTVLEIIQEAAKRLCIIVPKTIVLADIQSKEYDADTGLLVSCLNGCIKQNMVLNLFNQNILFTSLSRENGNWQDYLYVDFNIPDDDFVLNLSLFCPDFEELLGDGINFAKDGQSYLFRQLTHNDFLRLCKRELDDVVKQIEYTPDPDEEISDYRKNMPSEKNTYIKNADNLESGFYVYSKKPKTRLIYFCNNMATFGNTPLGDTFNLSFTYRSNWGVISADGNKRQESVLTNRIEGNVSNDNQTLTIPDELAILGTMIKYKSYYGMDFSLDLGEQKSLIDTIKQNQENVQVTHLDKKNYISTKMR
jgi:hypothetical protein